MPDPTSIGRALAALRAARGFTQAELAEASGVEKTRVSRYERGAGEPSPRTLNALLRALGVTLPGFRHLMDALARALDGEARPAAGLPGLPEDLARLAPGLFGGRRGEGASEAEGAGEAAEDPEVERLAREVGELAARLVRLHFRRLERPSEP